MKRREKGTCLERGTSVSPSLGKVQYSLRQRHEGLWTDAKFIELRSMRNELSAICYLHSFSPLEKFTVFRQLWWGGGVRGSKVRKRGRKRKTKQLAYPEWCQYSCIRKELGAFLGGRKSSPITSQNVGRGFPPPLVLGVEPGTQQVLARAGQKE